MAWVTCLNPPVNRIIWTRNTKVEMAGPEVCQNLMVLKRREFNAHRSYEIVYRRVGYLWSTLSALI